MNVTINDLVPGDMLADIRLDKRSCGDVWFVIAVEIQALGSMRITFLYQAHIINHVYDSDVTLRSVTIVSRESNGRV